MSDQIPANSDGVVGVVIVDDHTMFSQSLALMLGEEDDIEVLGVGQNGVEALELVAQLSPAVVLIDYHMPGQDGISVTTSLKRLYPALKVVLLTGGVDDRILAEAIEAGCNGFLTKDQRASEVVDAIRAAASGEAVMSPALLARLLPQLNRSRRLPGADLTERERELLVLLADGLSNKAIAEQLHLSVNTVRNYVQSILQKLNAHSKLEAVAAAVREGIIHYPAH